tara:strand:- start:19 stop:741 length:723 start_codon:yes stop_codon:yes gene_type:complete
MYYLYFKPKLITDKSLKNDINFSAEKVLNTLNIKLIIKGKQILNKPILFISNHGSYLDPIILKYLNPNVITLSKDDANKEIFLSRMMSQVMKNYGTILYKRGNKKSGSEVRKQIKKIIKNDGKSLLLFPEGKSYVGGPPNIFYKGSFEVAFENNIEIQPITINYSDKIGWGMKEKYSKPYNYKLLDNLNYLMDKKHNVKITYHPIVSPKNFINPESLKIFCHYVISKEWYKNYKINIINK